MLTKVQRSQPTEWLYRTSFSIYQRGKRRLTTQTEHDHAQTSFTPPPFYTSSKVHVPFHRSAAYREELSEERLARQRPTQRERECENILLCQSVSPLRKPSRTEAEEQPSLC